MLGGRKTAVKGHDGISSSGPAVAISGESWSLFSKTAWESRDPLMDQS